MAHQFFRPVHRKTVEQFGDAWTRLTIANLKGLTGHPQAAGLEDAVALRALQLTSAAGPQP